MINAIALSQTRTARGLSVRKLGRLSGLSYQLIRRIEAGGDDGNLTLREFERLCTVLDADPADLLNTRMARTSEPVPIRGPEELDLGQAALLRRLQRGQDIRRHLSTNDRETVLPGLVRQGLVRSGSGGLLHLSVDTARDLSDPETLI